jgi:VIT1/CCC1 family predicted Fe2+/Mn2+ transporter
VSDSSPVQTRTQTTAPGQPQTRRVLPRIGWGLLISSVVLWFAIPVLPFLPISGGQQLAAAAAILIVAEVLFWVGAAIAGPEAVRRVRSWWRAE